MNKRLVFFFFVFFLWKALVHGEEKSTASVATSVAKSKSMAMKIWPENAFDMKTGTPLFLAGDALVLGQKKGSIQFVYGKIRFPERAVILISKENDRHLIQNLSQPVEVTLNKTGQIRLDPYFEMILHRDISRPDGFVIEQLRPLDLKTHLIKFQKITQPDPQFLITYGRSLKEKIEQAKEAFAEISQETAVRKPAEEEPEEKPVQKKPIKKSLRQRFEERALGHTLSR